MPLLLLVSTIIAARLDDSDQATSFACFLARLYTHSLLRSCREMSQCSVCSHGLCCKVALATRGVAGRCLVFVWYVGLLMLRGRGE